MGISFLIVLCFSIFVVAPSGAFRVQSVGVRGQLFCGNKPAANTLVQLYDEDDGPDPDDLLDKTYTSEDGSFELKGDTMELTNIDPEIRIYHDCAMHLPLCKREWIIGIPDKYIYSGTTPKKFMNIGQVNLEVELETEDRHDCFH
ncbi:transthyretin-like family domain-containing protein [Ditylenchus destructor]|uniref:Transthyretin-like family domain-containing protein n=1 Tax=Ditylenchus destructor TaxID=166010 RepID=A0AAD4NDS8_9BILA|nr:transthyretin-like family domain-containing protein [Ditylenchus destructor]